LSGEIQKYLYGFNRISIIIAINKGYILKKSVTKYVNIKVVKAVIRVIRVDLSWVKLKNDKFNPTHMLIS